MSGGGERVSLVGLGLTSVADAARRVGPGVRAVTHLRLHGNALPRAAGLAAFPALTHLDLSSNALASAAGLAAVAGTLVALNLAANALTDLEGLGPCPRLQWLSLAHNRLASARAVAPLLQAPGAPLWHLDLRGNRLDTLEALAPLAPAPGLAELLVAGAAGNAAARRAGYRDFVWGLLPRLGSLDGADALLRVVVPRQAPDEAADAAADAAAAPAAAPHPPAEDVFSRFLESPPPRPPSARRSGIPVAAGGPTASATAPVSALALARAEEGLAAAKERILAASVEEVPWADDLASGQPPAPAAGPGPASPPKAAAAEPPPAPAKNAPPQLPPPAIGSSTSAPSEKPLITAEVASTLLNVGQELEREHARRLALEALLAQVCTCTRMCWLRVHGGY
jgi:hypothetical protein